MGSTVARESDGNTEDHRRPETNTWDWMSSSGPDCVSFRLCPHLQQITMHGLDVGNELMRHQQ